MADASARQGTVTVRLADTPRRLAAAFPLESVGFIENHPVGERAYRGKLELCVRLGATKAATRDRLDGELHVRRIPNVIFKLPEVLHEYAVDAPRDAVYFAYAPRHAAAMRRAGLFAPPLVRELGAMGGLRRLFGEIRALLPHSQEEGVADHLDMLALRVFAECLLPRPTPPGEEDAAGLGVAKIRRIASRLQLHWAEPVDWDALARENGLSRRQFFRLWKSVFRTGPAGYLRGIRMEEARRLLRETALPASHIALRVGFADPAYFHAAFKRHVGVAPGAWRNPRRRRAP